MKGKPKGLIGARVLVVLASVLLFFSILATWIRAEVIDTNGWTRTSVELLANTRIRQTVSSALSERIVTAIDSRQLAAEKLPHALQPLAGILSTAAAQVVPDAVERALAAPAVQELWGNASREAHGLVMKLLNGGSGALTTAGGVVTINLGSLLAKLGTRLGVGSEIATKLPPHLRTLVLFRSGQLKLAQNGVKTLRHLSFILPLLVILMYIASLAIAAGRRRRVLLEIGAGIVLTSLLAIVLRRWIESYVVDSLVHDVALRPAVHEVLAISTSGWVSRAAWLLGTGVLVLFAGSLAGPMRWAVALRRMIAGPLESHPAWFAGGLVAVLLAVASLAPTRTPGQVLPLLIELVLALVGLLALRRQIAAERSPGGPAAPTPAA